MPIISFEEFNLYYLDGDLKMLNYTFIGLVLPERAQISLETGFNFHLKDGDNSSFIKISIILNQVTVWVETEVE